MTLNVFVGAGSVVVGPLAMNSAVLGIVVGLTAGSYIVAAEDVRSRMQPLSSWSLLFLLSLLSSSLWYAAPACMTRKKGPRGPKPYMVSVGPPHHIGQGHRHVEHPETGHHKDERQKKKGATVQNLLVIHYQRTTGLTGTVNFHVAYKTKFNRIEPGKSARRATSRLLPSDIKHAIL